MKQPRVFYGWWIVAAGMAVAGLASSLFHFGFSAFFIPWRESFGWSRAVLGSVVGLSRLEIGLVAPVAGWFIDRYGPRRVMLLGMGMMGLGFFALSQVNSLLMLYIVFIGFLAPGISLGTDRPVQVAVANWFSRRRGRAMGLLMTGAGLGGSAVFLFAMVIDTFGWRTGAVFAGFVVWGVGLPLAWVIRHKPEEMGLLPDGDRVPAMAGATPGPGVEDPMPQRSEPVLPLGVEARDEATTAAPGPKPHRFWMRDPRPEIDLTVWQALRTRAFWLMALTWAIWMALPVTINVHIAPFLAEELELDYVVALGTLSFFVAASLIGRVGFGFLADYVNLRLLVASLLIMEGGGLFLFSEVQTLAQIPFYVIIAAIPYGGTLPMRGVLQGYFFGRKEFGTIGGLLTFVELPATVAAPIWVGWLADTLPGGYRIGLKVIAAMLIVGAFSILMARRPRSPLPPDRAPSLLQAFRRG